MAFHEIRFPANLSFGSVGGPERRTEIVAMSNGHEERRTPPPIRAAAMTWGWGCGRWTTWPR